jgi:NitT/TauT family transport system ATP-binding protein/taurine transport system ATP-binding protein
VELGPKLRGASKQARRARAETELDRVGLSEFADRAVYELSGGMQQRTQIARVLANDPQMMLMDEPFGALDALTREHLQAELQQIWRDARPTILLITHSVEEAVALGTRVVVMSQRPGRIVLDIAPPFAAGIEPLDDIRTEPSFVELCSEVRSAIEAGGETRGPKG